MIDNSDRIGNYLVVVIANKNRVASFECPTVVDCQMEVARLVEHRRGNGKVVSSAQARRLKGKSGNVRLYDDPIDIDVSASKS